MISRKSDEERPSAAKAAMDFCELYGTAEAVPLQNCPFKTMSFSTDVDALALTRYDFLKSCHFKSHEFLRSL